MCELYVKADPILYESRSRSLRICGVVTTLRLENQFWDILGEIAEIDGMTTNQLIAKLYEEVMDYRGEVVNFASFLRVSCTRYLSQRRAAAWASSFGLPTTNVSKVKRASSGAPGNSPSSVFGRLAARAGFFAGSTTLPAGMARGRATTKSTRSTVTPNWVRCCRICSE